MTLRPVPSYRLSLSRMSIRTRTLLIVGSLLPIFPFVVVADGHFDLTRLGPVTAAMFLAAVLFLPAHEALHGLIFWLYTRRVSFGFKPWTSLGPVFYAASVGSYFSRRQYQLACLAPQFLTILAAGMLTVFRFQNAVFVGLAYAAAMNLGGGIVDMFVFIVLFRFPNNSKVEDTQTGMDVYLLLPGE